ncbi:hypothetical protein BdWA1_001380 [Babesia duncani]|uniref:Uncharacterized protein n=1 Tax=Babesia duncani TaxID=323732 RepID=A0AAD9UQR1_9APIC|nr:hypothetical protein BdWA1_001380 [Babesia duncani]
MALRMPSICFVTPFRNGCCDYSRLISSNGRNLLLYNTIRRSSNVTKTGPTSLYEATAVPLESLKGVKLPSKAAPGLKSCRIFDNPNIIDVSRKGVRETFMDRIYRYLDIGGFMSMINSRKIHILRTPPEGRLGLMCSTELERKQSLIMKAVCSIMLFYLCVRFVEHKRHIFDRQPSPGVPVYDFTHHRSKDFTWHGSLPFQYPKKRCKECRWLELECKKRCYDRLLQEGHEFMLSTPMQIPRRKLLPSPYPPSN